MNKYIIRKLVFIVTLGLLVYAPFGIAAYRSATTQDPYVLMAREIESLPIGGIDVLAVDGHKTNSDMVIIVIFVPEYPNWSERKDVENFKRDVIRIALDSDYSSVLILLGWDYPPPDYRVQGTILCEEPRADLCAWEYASGVSLNEQYTRWPGIGKP